MEWFSFRGLSLVQMYFDSYMYQVILFKHGKTNTLHSALNNMSKEDFLNHISLILSSLPASLIYSVINYLKCYNMYVDSVD
jgi:hypothetical protein